MPTKTVLVVDDERHVVNVVEQMLTRRGYRVEAVGNGEQALASIRQSPPDLVLLDLMLPGIDGASVAQALLDEPLTAAIPVVFLTGLMKPAEMERRGSATGGRYFLAKPFDAEQLYEVIDMALPAN